MSYTFETAQSIKQGKMKITDYRDIAKRMDIRGRTMVKKDELIQLISRAYCPCERFDVRTQTKMKKTMVFEFEESFGLKIKPIRLGKQCNYAEYKPDGKNINRPKTIIEWIYQLGHFLTDERFVLFNYDWKQVKDFLPKKTPNGFSKKQWKLFRDDGYVFLKNETEIEYFTDDDGFNQAGADEWDEKAEGRPPCLENWLKEIEMEY